jgi:hypothetical protein
MQMPFRPRSRCRMCLYISNAPHLFSISTRKISTRLSIFFLPSIRKRGENLNFKVLLRIVWEVERVCGALKSLLPSVSNEALQTGKCSVILEAALELFGGRANKAISKKKLQPSATFRGMLSGEYI